MMSKELEDALRRIRRDAEEYLRRVLERIEQLEAVKRRRTYNNSVTKMTGKRAYGEYLLGKLGGWQ